MQHGQTDRASQRTRRVLLLEPDAAMRERIAGDLHEADYEVTAVARLVEATGELRQRRYDACLVALDGLGRDPGRGIPGLRHHAQGTPILVLCPPQRVQSAVRLLRRGAEDYLLRPPDRGELGLRLARILEHHELDSRVHFLQDQVSKRSGFEDLEARSTAMRALLEQLRRVAPMRSTVLIYGESGVGKELVARAIHFNSPRRDHPFIALNCAALPANLIESELFGHEKGSFTGAHARFRGKFEIAHRGTLFLDEIGEMAPATQVKLLRLLEEREFMRVGGDRSIRVDVRVIAATNADLEARIAESAFRQDLYYRLKVVTLAVPPLRDRREDIPALVALFVDRLSRANAMRPKSVAREAVPALESYPWPGNVRELKNLIESLLISVTGDVIRLEDLPPSISGRHAPTTAPALLPGVKLADVEQELIRRTLEHTGGNRTHSAELLGIGVRTLQRKIRAYGLTIAPRRRRSRRS